MAEFSRVSCSSVFLKMFLLNIFKGKAMLSPTRGSTGLLVTVSILASWIWNSGRGVAAIGVQSTKGSSHLCEHLMPPPHTSWLVANVTKRRYSVWPDWFTERRLRIVLAGNGKTLMLQGGLVQVRLTEENIPVGIFESKGVTLYDCAPGVKNTAYVHEREDEDNIIFFWRVPPHLNSRIHNFTVFATFIKNEKVFWPVSIEVRKFDYTESEIMKLSMFDEDYSENNDTCSEQSENSSGNDLMPSGGVFGREGLWES